MATPVGTARPDVFLSYHAADRERVDAIRRSLAERGVRAFLDRQDLVAGLPWPQALEEALQSVRAVLVFVGGATAARASGLWQRREVWFALDRQAQEEGQGSSFPVVPVLLPGARPGAGFLFLNTWVDLRDAGGRAGGDRCHCERVDRCCAPAGWARRPSRFAPYRALEPFREEHAALFFGREAFAADAAGRRDPTLARRAGRPIGQREIVGRPGRARPAAAAPASTTTRLGRRGVPAGRRAVPPSRGIARPAPRAGSRRSRPAGAARKLGERLADGGVRLEDVVDRIIVKSHGTDRLLIVADQFEELFTLAPASHRQPFVTAVLGALDRAPFTLLLALRADFYGQAIVLDRGLSDRIQSGLVNLGPMTREELRRAVEQPAAKGRRPLRGGAGRPHPRPVEMQPGGLPLLEFALTELWERRDGTPDHACRVRGDRRGGRCDQPARRSRISRPRREPEACGA